MREEVDRTGLGKRYKSRKGIREYDTEEHCEQICCWR